MHHLLLVSLGPIQDLIASARRLQDLWLGSWLLSELSRTVALAVEQHEGVAVIFPAPRSTEEKSGIANKILARLPPGTDPSLVAADARRAQVERLRQIRDIAWSGRPPDFERYFDRPTAERQVDELIEYLWVAVPETGSYTAARAEAEKRLAALKNTRAWSQPPWRPAPGIPKSSLDGERESVIDDRVLDTRRRYDLFRAKGKEQLCGIGLLKRLAPEHPEIFDGRPPPFHSTAHLALGPVLAGLHAAPDGQTAMGRYLDALQALGLNTRRFRVTGGGTRTLLGHDGGLLLESRMTEHFTEAAPGVADADRPEQVSKATEELRDLLRTVGVREPVPYYAFLVADGDRMGRAIAGITTLDGHVALGRRLDEFAAGCSRIVAANHGTLIYAGGDDVIAILPLHTALACSRELATAFADTVRGTLSVGLGISHSREPMSDALALARRAERKAKELGNSLALIVAKRGGADLVVAGEWDDALDERLTRWVELLGAGALSAKAAHDLEGVAAHYEGVAVDEQRERGDEIRALALQVLARKRQRGGAKPAELDELTGVLKDPLGRNPAAELRMMSAELQVAQLLLRSRRQADGKVTP